MIRQYLSVAGLRALSFAFAGAFLALVAMAMPSDAFGRFSLALSVMQVVGTGFLSFGNLALLRFAREEYKATGQIGGTLGVRLALYGVVLALAATILWLVFPQLVEGLGLAPAVLPLLLLGLVVLSLQEMGAFCSQAVERYTGYGLAPAAFRLTQLVTVAVMFLYAATSWWVLMWGTIAGYAVGALINWTRIPRRTLRGLALTRDTIGRYIAYSWSTPIATASVVLVSWMDLWFLERYHGTAAVGVYAWAYSISLFATALITPIGALLSPRLIDLKVSGDREGLRRLVSLSKSLFAGCVVLAALAAGAFGAAGQWIDLGSYAGAIAPAMILVAATALQLGTNLSYQTALAHEDLISHATVVLVIGGLVNALGDWALVPALGGVGAAIATAGAFAVNMAGLLWIVERHLGRAPGPGLAQLMAFGAVAIVTVVLAVFLDSFGAPLLCAAVGTVLLFAGRRFGFFAGLESVGGSLSARSDRASVFAAHAIAWLAVFPGPSTRVD